ncbi:MAG: hypothetical protein V2I97_25235 [Desulfococcaceae bacterium]|jgi:hypothetical protein|nr:hypothetical protein [Desulfococcaceae bacterium]
MQTEYSDLMISDSYIFMLCKSEKIAEPLKNNKYAIIPHTACGEKKNFLMHQKILTLAALRILLYTEGIIRERPPGQEMDGKYLCKNFVT